MKIFTAKDGGMKTNMLRIGIIIGIAWAGALKPLREMRA